MSQMNCALLKKANKLQGDGPGPALRTPWAELPRVTHQSVTPYELRQILTNLTETLL